MKCSCPKCSNFLSEDLSAATEKARSEKCSICGASYWIQRESFILRGYAVKGERYCSTCGEALGKSTYCPGCVTIYPDYCIISDKKSVQRAAEKRVFSLSLSSDPQQKAGKVEKQSVASMSTGSKKVSKDFRRQLLMVGAAFALIAVITGAAFLYMRSRAESKFTTGFVVALYGIKAGTDQCMKMSELLVRGSRLADNDLKQLQSVNGEITSALKVLSTPPEKFRISHARLLKLSEIYDKLYVLCSTSGPSLEVATAAGDLDKQFNAEAIELKNVLPPPIIVELTNKAIRYKNLQFLLE